MGRLINYVLMGAPGFAKAVWSEAEANNMRITGLTVIVQTALLMASIALGVLGAYYVTPMVLANSELTWEIRTDVNDIKALSMGDTIARLVDWRCRVDERSERLRLSQEIERLQREYQRLTGSRYFEQRCY